MAVMWWFAPGTVCLIAWGVLAFGGEYPWAYAPLLVFASTVGVLGLVVPVAGEGVSRSVVLRLALVAAAIGLQLVPLGEPVLAAVSPARLEHDYRALLATSVPVFAATRRGCFGGTAADLGAAGADAPRAVVPPRALALLPGLLTRPERGADLCRYPTCG